VMMPQGDLQSLRGGHALRRDVRWHCRAGSHAVFLAPCQ
jgi:hypothetical protein